MAFNHHRLSREPPPAKTDHDGRATTRRKRTQITQCSVYITLGLLAFLFSGEQPAYFA